MLPANLFRQSVAATALVSALIPAGLLVSDRAMAADMAARMAPKAPLFKASAPVASWTGFYAGIDYGTVLSQSTATDTTEVGSVALADRGLTLGVHAGYDWQIAPSGVIGVVADIGYLGTDKRFTEFNDRITVGTKTDWYATARARAGFLIGSSLIYATGGAAFVHQTNTFGGNVTTGALPSDVTELRTGWVAGAGLETRLSQHWTAVAEYLYINAGGSSVANVAQGAASVASFSNDYHVLKSSLRYRFGPGAFEGLPIPFINSLPQLSPQHGWGGFYAGVNAGGAISLSQFTMQTAGFGPAGSQNGLNDTAFTGGVQAGYTWMLTPIWMIGAEADLNYMGSDKAVLDWFDPTATHKTTWLGTARARLGRSIGPALFYVTAGGAWARIESSFSGVSVTGDKTGWAAGGGTEIALDARWAAKLEYLYVDLGNDTVAWSGTTPVQFDHRYQLVRAGLNYSFNGPVVAKY